MNASTAINELSAIELARGLTRREWSAQQIVRACLDRIAQRESEVGAWEYLAADAALQHARTLDGSAVQGLLHGLPIGVKDIFDTADMPTGLGSPIYRDNQPRSDAAVIATCRSEGAIVLGKTVTTELATAFPGRTRNPLRGTHTPGGSSSGSAAAVADYMVPLALGTQTAGSVIRPAAFCGIVGYKPSFGKLVRAGVKSQSETLDTIGGFGRCVADLALLVAAMTGDQRLLALDVAAAPSFGLCRTAQWPQADADTQRAMTQAQAGLVAGGARVQMLDLPGFDSLAELQNQIMLFEIARSYSWERLAHAPLLSPVLQQMMEAGLAITPQQHDDDLAAAARARQQADQIFRQVDVLIAPSTIGEAPEGLDHTGDPVFCRQWSLLGLPCVHVPFLRGHTGMPVGLQVIGRFGHDQATLRAAQFMEQRLIQR